VTPDASAFQPTTDFPGFGRDFRSVRELAGLDMGNKYKIRMYEGGDGFREQSLFLDQAAGLYSEFRRLRHASIASGAN
jgi:hypothetical protein